MKDIYQLAEKGTLTEQDLQGLTASDFDSVNPSTQLTPLGVAVWYGHVQAAKILLKHRADPDGHRNGRPPLWVATSKPRGNSGELLIQILLDQGADPTLPSQIDGDKGSTPLWNAVKTRKSPDVISSLVDRGANPDKIVASARQSPRQLADSRKDTARLNAMLPRETRTQGRLAQAGLVTGFVMAIVYWVNRNVLVATMAGLGAGVTMMAKNAIRRRFKMSGWIDGKLGKYISQRKSIKDEDGEEKSAFKEEMHDIITKNHLDRFFPKGDPFLDNVVERALDLERKPTNQLNTKDLAHLALYQPVLYCDDSASMKQDQRKERQNALVQRITAITTRVVPDDEGIELRFINATTTREMSRPSLQQIDSTMKKTPFNGWTEIGTKLESKVLQNMVYAPLSNSTFKRPMLVSIITDGHPKGPDGTLERNDSLKQAIVNCGKKLETYGFNPKVVRFQISQIGGDPEAVKFLNQLDASGLDDVLYVTSERLDTKFQTLRDNDTRLEQWLLKLLMGPIIDAQAA